MTTRDGNALDWYSFNLPKKVRKGANSSEFAYGADRSRYKTVTVNGGVTETTVSVGSMFERVTKLGGSVVEYKHFVLGLDGASAIVTRRSNSANDVRYLHKDHLGSIDAITNESGAVVVRLSYDAFGKRRNPESWNGSPSAGDWTQINAVTHQAFTSHEQLDAVDLVHMKGRVFDPTTGRFISSDPFVQAPLSSQSFNRYSYVMNNPLSMTDPSGYSWLSSGLRKAFRHANAIARYIVNPTPKNLFESIKAAPGQRNLDRFVMTHQWAYSLGQFAATVATSWGGGFGGAVWASYYTYVATGSVTKAVRSGVITYATSLAMQAVAGYYGDNYNIGRVLAEGTIGGVSSELNGGSFAEGFRISAGFALLTWGALEMRKEMLSQSGCFSNGNPNCAGESSGARGDGRKLVAFGAGQPPNPVVRRDNRQSVH